MYICKLGSILPLAVLLSLPGCGPAKRHPMVQREIDQCVAGLANLIPDANARQKACECAANAKQADQVYNGVRDAAYEEAHDAKMEACGATGFASKDDPFGILKKDAAESDREAPVDSAEAREAGLEPGDELDRGSIDSEQAASEGY